MDASPDAGEGDVAMQMGGCCNRGGIETERQQRVDVVDRLCIQRAGNEPRLLPVRIGDADKSNPRETGEDARMVASHDAYANHSNAQQVPRAAPHRLHHIWTEPLYPTAAHKPIPSTACAG